MSSFFELYNREPDGSALRSWLAYDIAKKLDMPSAVETQFVNVYFNGKYNGLYLLTQHIDVSGGNIDIADLNKDNNKINGNGVQKLIGRYDASNRCFSYYTGESPDNVSGGYLLEFNANTEGLKQTEECWFQMDHNNFIFESPRYPTKEEFIYIYC